MRGVPYLLAVLIAACGTSPSGGDDAASPDSNPNAPDANPNAPDANRHAPDANPGSPDAMPQGHAITTVFVILMENTNWASPAPGPVIKGNSSANYINNTLLPEGAHAEAYDNVPNLHPSEPNYIWLVAGSNYNITTDADATSSHSVATTHQSLADLLEAANISWRSYQEDMPSGVCPLSSSGYYAAKHDPFVFFKSLTDSESSSSQHCKDHNVDFSKLATDLAANTQARFNFITPNLCDDMHGASGCPSDNIKTGDNWLKTLIPQIKASPVYQAGHAAIFVTWDESELGDYPIGMIVISPYAKTNYSNTTPYSHSSTLRTMEEIFGLSPMLGDAANATSLSAMFTSYP